MEPCTLQMRNAASRTFDIQANHLMLRAPETCKGLAACSVLSVLFSGETRTVKSKSSKGRSAFGASFLAAWASLSPTALESRGPGPGEHAVQTESSNWGGPCKTPFFGIEFGPSKSTNHNKSFIRNLPGVPIEIGSIGSQETACCGSCMGLGRAAERATGCEFRISRFWEAGLHRMPGPGRSPPAPHADAGGVAMMTCSPAESLMMDWNVLVMHCADALFALCIPVSKQRMRLILVLFWELHRFSACATTASAMMARRPTTFAFLGIRQSNNLCGLSSFHFCAGEDSPGVKCTRKLSGTKLAQVRTVRGFCRSMCGKAELSPLELSTACAPRQPLALYSR